MTTARKLKPLLNFVIEVTEISQLMNDLPNIPILYELREKLWDTILHFEFSGGLRGKVERILLMVQKYSS